MAAVALQLRSRHRSLRNPLIQLFSSSSNRGVKKESQSTQSTSSYLSDVNASPSVSKELPSYSPLKHSNVAFLDHIHRNLSEFRCRSSSSLPDGKASTSSTFSSTQTISFDVIRESKRQFTISHHVFAKELGSQSEKESLAQKVEYIKRYNYEELGEKLCELRPTTIGTKGNKNCFSLHELNERLKKLRELEAEEDEFIVHGRSIFDHRTGTQNLMLAAPKEELVEKHFYPDNMSSEEKLKMELEKVRHEFKMSESVSDSSRVQGTQLTTKIKYLISAPCKKFIRLSKMRKFLMIGLNTILFTIIIILCVSIIHLIIIINDINLYLSTLWDGFGGAFERKKREKNRCNGKGILQIEYFLLNIFQVSRVLPQ